MRHSKHFLIFAFSVLFLSACTVGPDYVKPSAPVPVKFKEAKKHWKIADPQDAFDRGQWWLIFHDSRLNALEQQVNISNQTVATAEAQFQQAMALVDAARASYFPTLAASATITRQRVVSSVGSNSSSSTSAFIAPSSSPASLGVGGSSSISSRNSSVFTNHSLLLNASWEPDIWGGVRRQVEANLANAQSDAALLASAQLSAQASLAQFYFELRALDEDQKILNETVAGYNATLKLTKNQYASGTAALADKVQAESQLESAQALAINNGILRAQYEHAIAILIGKPPADFSLAFSPTLRTPPSIPITVPSELLERRPDIASSERLMAQANAQIGVAIYAYYPSLTLSGAASYQHNGLEDWFSMPGLGWSLGPQLAETILDGGLRSANVRAARANYDATIATYRETVLTAFQNVEDNLVSLRILREERVVDDKAAANAKLALRLVLNQYKSGTVPYSSVITAQIAAYTAEKTAADVRGLEMTSAVGLVKALGGGWKQG